MTGRANTTTVGLIASIAILLLMASAPRASDTALASDAAGADAKPPPHRPSRVRTAGSLQNRVDVLSKALELDARQKAQLLAILENQKRAVTKIWSDPVMLPAERTPATRALQERTADQIRGILTDEQKKRYNPPKPQGVTPQGPDVEEWMRRQSQARQQQ